jgi:hypothetical protein
VLSPKDECVIGVAWLSFKVRVIELEGFLEWFKEVYVGGGLVERRVYFPVRSPSKVRPGKNKV